MTSIDRERFRDALLDERRRVEHALATLRDEHRGSLDDEVEEIGASDNHLAETLALPRTALTLVSGHGGREKIVELTGVGPALIERRLASATQAVRPGAGGVAGGASSQQPDRGRKERR